MIVMESATECATECDFLALLYRLRFVPRWSGTRTIEKEDVAQHSLNVALVTHMLCEIKNNIFKGNINIEKAILYAMYHDATDSVLTHVITPIRSHKLVKNEFKKLKYKTSEYLMSLLPVELKASYLPFIQQNADGAIVEMVEIANQIDLFCKAKSECLYGNLDFGSILKTAEEKMSQLSNKHDFVAYFSRIFLRSFGSGVANYRYIQ